MLVVQFEFCKVVLLEEGFTLNPTDEGYAIDATSLDRCPGLSSNNICHLTVVAADGITYRRVGYLTIIETVTIVN